MAIFVFVLRFAKCDTDQCAGSSNRLEDVALKSRACDALQKPSCPQPS